jgi:hypothetical protein
MKEVEDKVVKKSVESVKKSTEKTARSKTEKPKMNTTRGSVVKNTQDVTKNTKEVVKKPRYSRILKAENFNPLPEADKAATFSLSYSLLSSIRFWPVDTGLQIDIIQNPAKSFDKLSDDSEEAPMMISQDIYFTQLGADFPDWQDDIIDIFLPLMNFVPSSKKQYTEDLKRIRVENVEKITKSKNLQAETLELVPFTDILHLKPEDFERNAINKKNQQNKNPLQGIVLSDGENLHSMTLGGNISINSFPKVFPAGQLIDTNLFFQKFDSHLGNHLRMILSPVPEDEEIETRQEYMSIYHDYDVDWSAPIVNLRTTISSPSGVSYDIKRMMSEMVTDSTFTKLSKSEIDQLNNSPLEAVKHNAKIHQTAMGYLRWPTLDFSTYSNFLRNKAETYREETYAAERARIAKLVVEELKDQISEEISLEVFKRTSELVGNVLNEVVDDILDEKIFDSLNEIFDKAPRQAEIDKTNPPSS